MAPGAGSESEEPDRTVQPSKVLVIDSDEVDRRLIRRLIGNRFQLLEAGDGRAGLDAYRVNSPECVLLDHALPDSNGVRVFDELVELRATVVLLTSEGDASDALDAVRRGAQDYLAKESLNEVMLERVVRYGIERDRLNKELYRSVANLKESEQRFSELAAHIDHGLWIWSADSEYCVYQNPANDRIHGRTLDEMNGINWFDVIHPDDREAEMLRASHSKATGTEYESRFRVVHPNGDVVHVEQSCFPLLDDDGEIVRVLGICRDITRRVALEEELRLAQKLEAVGQLSAGVAHEINTPCQYVSDNTEFLAHSFEDLLPVLQSFGELLDWARTSGLDAPEYDRLNALADKADLSYLLDEMPSALQQSRDGLDQIKKIVRAMKDFSHPGAEMESVDVNVAIESTVTVARNEWKYVAELELKLDPDLPRVVCVPSAINQVILNLVVNAAHAIEDMVRDQRDEKGRIRISTGVRGDQVQIEVSDTGCGMPKDVRDRVFDPFFTTKEVGKGTGQGLAIAHSVITERHSGTIKVSSEPGKGTTFTIRLPIDGQEIGHEGHAA